MIKSTGSFTASKNLELVLSGEDYFARLEAIIQQAQFQIYLQMYLFENDTTGTRIITALKEAASRKVEIYILLDGIGSLSFPSEIFKELKCIGVNIRFLPLYFQHTLFLLAGDSILKLLLLMQKLRWLVV